MARLTLEIERLSGLDVRRVSHDGIADGECPGCYAEPFKIEVRSCPTEHEGRKRTGGYCVACNDPVGWVYSEPDTIFGEEEDRAVLEHGRARVYGMEKPRG